MTQPETALALSPAELEALEALSAPELIRWSMERFGSRLAAVTSFQKDGMVVLDIAASIARESGMPLRVVTLDTGRLPAETYDMMEMVRQHYGLDIEAVFPEASEVESMVSKHGPNLMYGSVPARNLCCQIRKVRPLERKLAGFEAQLVGLRRSQSEGRQDVAKVAMQKGKWKISPLADWSREQVDAYLAEHNVPVHPLYARSYTSIGCGPCTRATAPGEPERAGRWWWEDGNKECGLHFTPEGKVERTLDVLLREVLANPVR
jgi:phosphoadenosine phosphosulfate reductase